MAYKKIIKRGTCVAAWLFALKGASLCKISFILGSTAAFFSGLSIVVPLVGAMGGIVLCSTVFCARILLHIILTGGISGAWLAFYVPGAVAALSWAWPSVIIRLIIPIVCMALFIAHPVGGPAWIYTLYWLIPVGIYLNKSRSIFAQALSSTFIAHAVGSVIWQYTVPMTSTAWLLLVPIVAVERILFASGMTILYYVLVFGQQYFGHYASKVFARANIRSHSA